MLRPSLRILHRGVRAVEEVSVHYPLGHFDPIFSPGSTASVTPKMNDRKVGRSSYVRAWVYNSFGFPAHKCQVFMDRILLNGALLEDERSPLHWTDIEHAYEFPMLRRGYRNGSYIDICASDSIDPRLQIVSLKGTKGYHRFPESGVYTLELCAEALRPCSFGHLTLNICHDGKQWRNLKVVSVS